MILLLIGACIENGVGADKGDRSPFDPGTSPPTDTGFVGADPCDGFDNNSDGTVDEGWPDFDADGIADCVDDACAIVTPTPRVEADPACAEVGQDLTPPAAPWEARLLWHAALGAVYGTPMVGDLDQDGVPEVVVGVELTPYSWSGDVVVLDGATGAVEQVWPGADVSGGVALGDVDGDGWADVVGYEGPGCSGATRLVARDRHGTERWSVPVEMSCESFPAITDLDGDGRVEVLGAGVVVDGTDGGVEATFDVLPEGTLPMGVDLDLDGVQEILVNGSVFAADGSLRFRCGPEGPGSNIQPAQLDEDPEGEVVVSATHVLVACDDDGTERWRRSHGALGATLALADFDGDAEQEIVFPNTTALWLLDADGTEIASVPISDVSGGSGPTLWDLDLDGVEDVIYADEAQFQVVDGATWTTGLRDLGRSSMTFFETPSVADVDGDGQGDLLFGNNTGDNGVFVLTAADRWPWTRPTYNQLAYYGENVTDALGIPASPDPPWRAAGDLFRGQPSTLLYAGDHELDVAITDVCAASCAPGAAGSVAVQVWNSGAAGAPAGTLLVLWAEEGGVMVEVGRVTLDGIAAGTSVEEVFPVTAEALGRALEARLTPPVFPAECDPDDDVDRRVDLPCP